ncbi:hypothetical protein [Nonomuraea sp. SYSU D8015]|uniref:hypothetical protein n=1 Tax=Nonomuraea sp. SYSU D8015 TaxID=2593644 RepID=UPI001660249D|nr:hypothetical protein [Nonomuraea sp. SYSU D8015]
MLTLLLIGLPQLFNAEYPFVGVDPADQGGEGNEVVAEVTVVTAAAAASPLAHRLLEYALNSGVTLLLAATVLVLPREQSRRITFGVAGILALFGISLGYVGMSGLESSNMSAGFMLFLSPFYLLAAVTLVIGERQAASMQTAGEASAGDVP